MDQGSENATRAPCARRELKIGTGHERQTPKPEVHALGELADRQGLGVAQEQKRFSRASRAALLGTAMASCGIELPCEKTLYRGVAILNHCQEEYDMSEEEIQAEMEKLQGFVKAHKRRTDISFIVYYPVSPTQLADDVRAVMFPDCLPVDGDS